jgi:hypothetical protein
VKVVTAVVAACWVATVTVASSSASASRTLPAPRYADGAPPGFSGAFGENACDGCHFEGTVNSRPGHVTLDGVPARFTPGAIYPVVVSLERSGMMTAGFQLTARFRDGGHQAGTLAVARDQIGQLKVEEKDAVQYVNQRASGTALAAPGLATWTVLWTAPPQGGAVRFDVAANAGNRDESAGGDFVFTTSRESLAPR